MFLEQFPDDNRTNGWIEVICGSMFSGKTEELIRRIRRAEFAQQSILLVKPKVDNRYSAEQVVTHTGIAIEAKVMESSAEILSQWKKEKIVAVDEAQFFDNDLSNVCSELANKGARVIVAGLDMDFKGVPFGPMPNILAMAEYVTKVHAICLSCGNLAQFSHRKVTNEDQVMLGAVNDYEPLCRTCYNKIQH
jgi:thymidine kinase